MKQLILLLCPNFMTQRVVLYKKKLV